MRKMMKKMKSITPVPQVSGLVTEDAWGDNGY
ncbi:hypothetical protein CCACVL1_23290, partial [Corchorus capsularis]